MSKKKFLRITITGFLLTFALANLASKADELGEKWSILFSPASSQELMIDGSVRLFNKSETPLMEEEELEKTHFVVSKVSSQPDALTQQMIYSFAVAKTPEFGNSDVSIDIALQASVLGEDFPLGISEDSGSDFFPSTLNFDNGTNNSSNEGFCRINALSEDEKHYLVSCYYPVSRNSLPELMEVELVIAAKSKSRR